jgi:hypothetical protein
MKGATHMKRSLLIGFTAISLGLVTACGPPPRVMTSQGFVSETKPEFIGETKVFDEIMQISGQQDPATKQVLFNFSVRICNVEANATGSNCKDTQVLENVNPRSLY